MDHPVNLWWEDIDLPDVRGMEYAFEDLWRKVELFAPNRAVRRSGIFRGAVRAFAARLRPFGRPSAPCDFNAVKEECLELLGRDMWGWSGPDGEQYDGINIGAWEEEGGSLEESVEELAAASSSAARVLGLARPSENRQARRHGGTPPEAPRRNWLVEIAAASSAGSPGHAAAVSPAAAHAPPFAAAAPSSVDGLAMAA